MKIVETVGALLKTAKTKVLSMGTPPEKEVLYQNVIKRKVPKESAEKLMFEGIKNSVKSIFPSKVPTQVGKDITPEKTVPKNPTKKKPVSETSITTKPVTKKPITKKDAKKKTTTKTSPTKKAEPKAVTSKKSTTSVKKPTKKPVAKKTPAAPKGAKKAEKIALYIEDIKKHYGEVDEAFVAIIVKNLGPSIYKQDAELVSCSDPKELDTVRRNFLIKKLGIEASNGVLNAAIEDVCKELKGVRRKYRATFYYALAKKFKKESVLS